MQIPTKLFPHICNDLKQYDGCVMFKLSPKSSKRRGKGQPSKLRRAKLLSSLQRAKLQSSLQKENSVDIN